MINRVAAVSRMGKLLTVVQNILLIILMTGCGVAGGLTPPATPTPAPTPLPPITISVAYSTEKEEWLTAAAAAFNQQYKGQYSVVLKDSRGSLDGVNWILQQASDPKQKPHLPTIWSPASYLELNLLNTKWEDACQHQCPDIIDKNGEFAPQTPVHSPLVLAVWQNQADVLSNSSYKALTWQDIHDLLLLHDWGQIGGDRGLGEVKLAQTEPDKSNSGLMTLLLLTHSYFQQQADLPPDEINKNAGFSTFLKEIEDHVWCFGPSSGTYMNSMIARGPNTFDIIATYENLVLEKVVKKDPTYNQPEAQGRWGEPLVMYYPPEYKLIADHPFAVLQGDWVTPAQQQAALIFLQFLKEPAQQQSALTWGLRPDTLKITDNTVPGNLFLKPRSWDSSWQFPQFTLDPDLKPVPQPPSLEVVDALITLWQNLKGGEKDRQC